jgi:hypothetical protein
MDHRAGRYISFATLYEDYACRYTSIEAIMYSPQVSPLYFLSERLILYLYTPHWTKKVHHFSLCSAAIIGAFMTVCNGQPMRCTYLAQYCYVYVFTGTLSVHFCTQFGSRVHVWWFSPTCGKYYVYNICASLWITLIVFHDWSKDWYTYSVYTCMIMQI